MSDSKSGAAAKKEDDGTSTVTLASGTKVTRAGGKTPGPTVSNGDIDFTSVTADSKYSTIHPNPDWNEFDADPPPGPSVVEVLGAPKASDS